VSTPAHITQSLNTLAHSKAAELLARAKKILDTPKYRASGNLVDSLEVSVKPGTATEPPVITLTFADQGKFLGMKNPSWGRVPDIEQLEKWVRARGTSRFKYVTGRKPSGLSESEKVSKIASGIAWAYRKHQLRWKPKTWRKVTLLQLVEDLNDQTARVWEEGIKVQVEDELYKS
jgi:hypothetical protein